MGSKVKFIYKTILVFGIYHLVRDILQIIGVENVLTQVASKPHEWAKVFGEYHQYLSLPLDLIMIFGPLIILKRDKSGNWGVVVFLSVTLLILMWLVR